MFYFMYQNNYNGFQQMPVRTTPIGLKGKKLFIIVLLLKLWNMKKSMK